MNEYADLMTEGVFRVLADHGVAGKFVEALRLRAESIIRNLPATPVENRPMAEGQAIFCYELVDGAESAVKAKEAEAKADFAGDNPEDEPLV